MGWLIGIAAVMLAAHLYFRYGARRLERKRSGAAQAPPESARRDD